MSEFHFTTKRTKEGEESLVDLDEKWGSLEDSFNSMKNISCDANNVENISGDCEEFNDSLNTFLTSDTYNDYVSAFSKYMGKVDGTNESLEQSDKMKDIALMRPINMTFGIMLLSILIYELYSN